MFAYVVTSYRDPEQVFRLLHRLRKDSPAALLVVSHDKKSERLEPSRLDQVGAVGVTTPSPVQWGDATYLESVLAVLERLDLASTDWLTVLTAQDYPVRPLHQYEQHLASCGADMLLEQTILHAPESQDLLLRYHARSFVVPRALDRWFVRGVLRRTPGLSWHVMPHGLATRLDVRRRWPFPDLHPTMGADLYALSGRAVQALVRVTHDRPDVLRHYRRTRIPSESYVHTVLLSDPSLVNRPEDLHFRRWSGAPHPDDLGVQDLPELLSSPRWFARKFRAGDPVLDRLDEVLDASPRPAPAAAAQASLRPEAARG